MAKPLIGKASVSARNQVMLATLRAGGSPAPRVAPHTEKTEINRAKLNL